MTLKEKKDKAVEMLRSSAGKALEKAREGVGKVLARMRRRAAPEVAAGWGGAELRVGTPVKLYHDRHEPESPIEVVRVLPNDRVELLFSDGVKETFWAGNYEPVRSKVRAPRRRRSRR